MMQDANFQPERPEMSGALPGDNAIPQLTRRSGDHSSTDHALPREHDARAEEEFRAPPPQRRQSFFVISNRRRDGRAEGNIAPSGLINISTAQRTNTFEIGKRKKRRKKRRKESSLDALLRHAVNGPIVEGQEAQIPLPDSRPASSSSVLSGPRERGDQVKSSLDIISKKSTPPAFSERLPSSIPLPESRTQSSEEPRNTQPQQPPQQEVTRARLPPRKPPLPLYQYEHMVTRASAFLNHLRDGRIHAPSRHDSLNISYLDYRQAPGSPPIVNRPDTRDENSVLSVLGNIPDDVIQRLIVVEDLSFRTINCLGRRFGVNPEFFEEHLINSGYEGLHYSDPPAHTWTTSGLKRSHVSMRWHRPVFRLPVVPFSENDLKELLDPAISRLEYTSDTSRHINVYQTQTNIFRSEWGLWTNPTITPLEKRVCGWEERASIWSQKLPDRDCQIIILILDPLPTLGQGIEQDAVAVTRVRNLDYGDSESNVSSGGLNNQRSQRMTDEEIDQLTKHMRKREFIREPQLTWVQRMLQFFTGRGNPENDSDGGSESEMAGKYEYFRTKTFVASRTLAIFEQTAHRAHVLVNFDDAFRSPQVMDTLRKQLSETRPTTVDFWQRLTSAEHAHDGVGFHGVVKPLFQIVHQDSTNLLKLLHNSLDGISLEILDDVKMEERLTMWRLLITRAQLELPELKRSITQFFSFLQILDPSGLQSTSAENTAEPAHIEENAISQEFRSLCKQIDEMMQRLQTASSSLTSNMALLDSRRSIAEAQAVTKLTELAFFFIPLSFVATLFGMQIKQFENRAPLSIFVVIGLGTVAASYLVRLLIRSTWLRNLVQTYQASIKVYADSKRRPVQRGNVPASLFISWAGYKLNSAVRIAISRAWTWLSETIPKMLAAFWESTGFVINMLLIISVLAAAPISVLWTRNIDHGIKIMITILILVCVIGLFAAPYWRYADSDSRAALPRLLKKSFKHFHASNSKLVALFIIFCAIAIAVVPLTIIWTRPIASGIRAAITVVIVLMVVMSIVSWAIYKLVSTARMVVMSSNSGSVDLSELFDGSDNVS